MKQTAKPGTRLLGKIILILATGLFFLPFWPVTAAEITVPDIEMASRGRMDDGEFVLTSIINADLALSGGYKYAFLLGFSLEVDNSAGYTQALPFFRIAKATARELFGLPLEMSYFFGSGDDFCTGDEFSYRFGISPFGTDFRGFFYFSEGIGGDLSRRYNGIHGVRGTGLSFSLTKWENIIPMFYVYQHFADFTGGNPPTSLYSGDLRLLFFHDWLRLDVFGGISINTSIDKDVRGGLMVHIAGNGVEFFAQAGIPGWRTDEKFAIDHLFFLIEPRLYFDRSGIIFTFFYHPVEYIHITTYEERGKADINLKFLFGNPVSGFAGGFETGGELKIDEMEDIVFRISPFASFISGGLKWDAKIRIIPQNFKTPSEMIELFIGVRTAF